ncbi:enamine deaminase RidA (YjgF/YER057c/UK114 family) [Cryobacterium sp. CAN_C3]|nr:MULTISPECIES: hypothetical protein [unclassified Cryobacterium]MEC5155652.1 enamine deaminase RidA (YjgF/YER057c/UK114 family) [Cryobacterium sp. CAN_C3]
MLFVGGQNGTDNTGVLLEGLKAQTPHVMRNVLAGAGDRAHPPVP